MPVCHAQQSVLGAEHGADDVGFHDLQQAELRHGLDAALLADGAGVVDQCGDRAELFVDALKQVDDLILDADVGPHGDSSAPRARTWPRRVSAAWSSAW